jgi:hypothetical protein
MAIETVEGILAIVTVGAIETLGAILAILTVEAVAEDAVSGTVDTATAVAAGTETHATIRLGLTLIASHCTCAAYHYQ